MKIGVISDTHGYVPAWEKAMKLFSDADIILHAGDVLYHPPRLFPGDGYDIPRLAELLNTCPVPVVIARGNCDSEVYEELLQMPVLSPYAFVQHGGLRIVVQHGHTLTEESFRRLAEKYRADFFITGHTHMPVIERFEGTVHLNPGSPSISKLLRDGVPIPTVGLITDGRAQVVELETGAELAGTGSLGIRRTSAMLSPE